MENNIKTTTKSELYAGLVWVFSAAILFIIGGAIALNVDIPGVEQTIQLLTALNTQYIYLTAFAVIFIEGLYVIGSFFPGASAALFLAILSTLSGSLSFLITTLLIFIGWCLAGAVNIYVAEAYRTKVIKLQEDEGYTIKSRPWATWYPSFRASHEVAQVIEGGNSYSIFFSSVRVKFWTSVIMGGIAFVVPYLFNINEITNREGYVALIVIALISLAVGLTKLRTFYTSKE